MDILKPAHTPMELSQLENGYYNPRKVSFLDELLYSTVHTAGRGWGSLHATCFQFGNIATLGLTNTATNAFIGQSPKSLSVSATIFEPIK